MHPPRTSDTATTNLIQMLPYSATIDSFTSSTPCLSAQCLAPTTSGSPRSSNKKRLRLTSDRWVFFVPLGAAFILRQRRESTCGSL
ncbi:hypothetical protein BGZ61DRAFT_468820, partial [Ilyonectria robusta]|uniref:uncharacterized protein n=1 Tax=Ilyonectria robusta TaxID=1079257 RepID=UPI001E8DF122